jgi:predicted Zn-dependent protease with MMP-like domain
VIGSFFGLLDDLIHQLETGDEEMAGNHIGNPAHDYISNIVVFIAKFTQGFAIQ